MKTFYFIGGPKINETEEFFRRLNEAGGAPQGWKIYPHIVNDGKALHIVHTESRQEILDHLRHFKGIYENSEIIEVIETKS